MKINFASKEDLLSLPYLGEVKADRIIRLREEAQFISPEDLADRVDGLGVSTVVKWELDYETKESSKEKERIARLETQLRHEKASHQRYKKLAGTYEEGLEIADRIVESVEKTLGVVPPVEIPVLPEVEGARNEEVAVLLMSDTHAGKKTPSYDHNVFKERMVILREGMMSIVGAQRTIRPVNKLVIVMAGDIVDAESIYPGQAVDGISLPVVDQVYQSAVPELTEFILFCLSQFEEVEIYCQSGNHGRFNAAKWSSSKTTNWDFVVYKTLEAVTREQDRLTWHINIRDWKSLFEIFGFGFLATHGDMIRMYYNLPWYGLTRQATRWQATYRDEMKLYYFLVGHFHSASMLRFNQAQIFVNGAFVTDDSYAERELGVGSVPEQILFGVHPEYGVSWRYILKLD